MSHIKPSRYTLLCLIYSHEDTLYYVSYKAMKIHSIMSHIQPSRYTLLCLIYSHHNTLYYVSYTAIMIHSIMSHIQPSYVYERAIVQKEQLSAAGNARCPLSCVSCSWYSLFYLIFPFPRISGNARYPIPSVLCILPYIYMCIRAETHVHSAQTFSEFLEMPGILSPLSCVSCPTYICAYVQRNMYIVRRRFQNFWKCPVSYPLCPVYLALHIYVHTCRETCT
jgi:hypothetical protein